MNMKIRGNLFIIAALAICAILSCSKNGELDKYGNSFEKRVFYAMTPSEDTKTYIDSDYSIHWTADDRISVFCSSTNEQYRFKGNTGDYTGAFENLTTPAVPTYGRNYAVYPYNAGNTCGSEGCIGILLPAEQSYAENSFGLGSGTMAAVTKGIDERTFKFSSACGYLMLKLYGGDRIKRIIFRGNNGEKIAGEATVTASYGNAPVVAMGEGATTEIRLNCPNEGVATQPSSANYTQFWIVVPPTTFTKGFTVDVTNTDDETVSRSTDKSVTIHRNKILKMAPVKVDAQNSHELLSFSLTDGVNRYNPIEITDSRVVMVAPNGGDFSSLTVNFAHNGLKVQQNGVDQISGVSKADFSSSTAPIRYSVIARNGTCQNYDVYLFDLPVLYINTPNGQSIVSKDIWVGNTSFKLYNTQGSIDLEVATNIKGRGNTTWGYPKKPYALKLSESKSIFGIPADKRWNLLANWADRTLMRNAIAFAISEKTESLEWTPRGQFVELFLNGTHLGNYFLCEHLKVSKNRVNITEMNPLTDIEGEALTGGYFLELDEHYDEPYKFRTSRRNLPVLFKNPDENVQTVQLNYVSAYINNLEDCLADDSRMSAREYLSYLDIDTFIDYFIVHEVTEYGGPSRPFSSHIYKDRSGVLKAGPVWDFDRDSFYWPVATKFINSSGLWYNYLFTDPLFLSRLQYKWARVKDNIAQVNETIDYYTNMLRRSAVYNNSVWPTTSRDNGDETLPFLDAATRLKNAFNGRILVLDNLIQSIPIDYDTKPGGNENVNPQDDGSGDFDFKF